MYRLIAAVLCLIGLPSNAEEALVFATSSGYPQLAFLADDGRPAGMEADVANAVYDVLMRPCDLRPVSWAAMKQGLADGTFDAGFGGISAMTSESLGFETAPIHLETASRFAVLRVTHNDVTVDALVGLTVGALWGTPHALWLEENLPPGALQRYPDDEEMILSLHAGRIDAVFGDGLGLYRVVMTLPVAADLELADPMVPLDSDGGGIAFALPANGADNAAIGEAVERLLADGTIDDLTRRHLPGYLPSP